MEVAFKRQLAPYGLSGKGTIRFPLSEPVPVRLIEQIATFRVKESAARAGARAAGSTAERPTRTASSRRARRR
jgi:uncharacterized protein YdhG (YjbR/CyaY superfamily)